MITRTVQFKQCGFCGTPQEVTVPEYSMRWGYMDLDTRPEPEQHDIIADELQYCRNCGYCRMHLEAEASPSIQDILNEPCDYNVPHQRYCRAYKIERHERGPSVFGAFLAMRAAWCCDDEALTEEAKTCRLMAVDEIKAYMTEEKYLPLLSDYLMLIDLHRRAGMFQEAHLNIDIISDIISAVKVPEPEQQILNFENHLVAALDSGCYNVGDAINFGKPDKPRRKTEVLAPSADDKALGRIVITGTFAVKNFDELIRRLKNGDQVQLCREPDNKYDSNAIRVDSMEGFKLGYIPKGNNPVPARLMDDGKLLYGIVCNKSEYDNSLMLEIFQSGSFENAVKLTPVESIQELAFEVSSWGSVPFKLYINSREHNVSKLYYTIAETHVNCNLKLKRPFGNEIPEGVIYKEISLPDDRFKEFVNALSDCRINYWEPDYDDKNTLDGMQWDLKIKYNGGQSLKCVGSNQYPAQWSRFIKALSEYIDPAADKYCRMG